MTFIIKLPKTMVRSTRGATAPRTDISAPKNLVSPSPLSLQLGPSEAYSEVDTKIPTLSLRGFVISSTISTPKILFGDVFYTVMQV